MLLVDLCVCACVFRRYFPLGYQDHCFATHLRRHTHTCILRDPRTGLQSPIKWTQFNTQHNKYLENVACQSPVGGHNCQLWMMSNWKKLFSFMVRCLGSQCDQDTISNICWTSYWNFSMLMNDSTSAPGTKTAPTRGYAIQSNQKIIATTGCPVHQQSPRAII